MARVEVVETGTPVMDLRPVFHVLGYLLCGTGATMLVPALVDLLGGPGRDPEPFSVAAAVSMGLGVLMAVANRGAGPMVTVRQTYLFTFLAWLLLPVVGALPLVFSDLELSYTDAFFETMSGLTTTGSTVLIGLDSMAPSILIWRALLQWVGGLGIVVMAIAILPVLRSGGMQLFHAESSDRSDKPLSRLSLITFNLCAMYLMLTVMCALAYYATGMTGFDAAVHAMTTLSTGGYSSHDASFGHFEGLAVHWVAIVFMLAGATPFMLFLRMTRGELAVVRDRQLQSMLLFYLLTVLGLAIWLAETEGSSVGLAIDRVAFNVASIMTTTGYASEDYGSWGTLAVAVFFYLMFVGGCTGSTSGAIKIFRFRVLSTVLSSYTRRRFQPHLVTNRQYDDKPLSADVIEGVMAFLALYFATVAVVAIGCAALGLDWITSLSGAVQAVGNIGPGLGPDIGPDGNFAGLPDAAKWLLALGMLAGRLELFTVLVILTPSFWRG